MQKSNKLVEFWWSNSNKEVEICKEEKIKETN